MRPWPRRRAPTGPETIPSAAPPAIEELELLAGGLADGLLAGESPSVFRGSGVEADGVRAYVAGDDIRAMDWRVTARTGRLHVRELVEERGLEAHLVLDRSASLHGCASGRPGAAAIEVAATLAATAHQAGHRVGLLQVTDRAESHVPPGQGRHQVRMILSALLGLRPSGTRTALGPALRGVQATVGARSLVAVISDFRVARAQRDEVGAALSRLAGRHDLLPVRIRTPGPHDLPAIGLVTLLDPENGGAVVVDSSDPRVRERLHADHLEAEAWWRDVLRACAVRHLDLDPFLPLRPQLVAGLGRSRGRAA
jgi:uncharacterized protein (DUF58 family)